MDADYTFPAGLHVLAVDDDLVCLKILERQLKYCNYNVTVVTDARTALDMLRDRKDDGNQFELVISNVVMPNMDGFKLLELIGLEMDLPVIMLSANSETQTIIKGIKHGACDYMVKPVRLEQLKGIWTHVVKNSRTDPRNSISSDSDDAVQKLPSVDAEKSEKVGANNTKNYSKKNKKVVDVLDEDNENKSAQKKQRVQWSGQLHRKFVEAVRQIGLARAAPKKILEIMNVEGLTRENVASHLQKYRIYLTKLSEGTLRNSNLFADETEALQRNMNVSSFGGSPSSSNYFAKINSSSTIGTQTLLPTQLVHVMSSQKNLDIPRSEMEPVGHGVNLSKDAMPMPVLDISKFISSGKSYALALNGQCFPSYLAGSSFGNISNGVVHSSNDNPPLTSNMCFSSSHSCTSYASILRSKILGSSRGIPFEDIADDEMMAPSSDLPFQSPELVNQPSIQLQSCSIGPSNKSPREVHQFAGPSNSWKADVPSRFSDLSHNVGLVPCSFKNDTHSTLTPSGNSALASSSSTRPDLQIDNSAMLSQVLKGGGASDNLHEVSTVNQQVISDQINNVNEYLMGTSDAQNAESDDLDDFLAYLVNQDFINNGDSFIDGDQESAP